MLRQRTIAILYASSAFPVRVDLTHIPATVRDTIRDELEDEDYGVYWNQDQETSRKATMLMNALLPGSALSQPDYWLIFPCKVE